LFYQRDNVIGKIGGSDVEPADSGLFFEPGELVAGILFFVDGPSLDYFF
jgi:hypothetical protein